jgi:hypothetical protein
VSNLLGHSMTTNAQTVLSVVMLGAAIWFLLFLLPRAWREGDKFGIACVLLGALLGLLAWLFIGVGTR